MSRAALVLLGSALLFAANPAWAGEAEISDATLPDAPQPQISTRAATPLVAPCPATNAAKPAAATGAALPTAGNSSAQPSAPTTACPPKNWFERFLTGPDVKPMTPSEKARLAARNVIDPFNGLTILASSAIAVGANAHSPVGPGMRGFGRDVGISYTEDITGEFFGTFLIPSIIHQDPHYHRIPKASIPRRVGHAIEQVYWTQGDNSKPMVNYANLVGFAIDDEIANLYVPGRQTNLPSSAERYGIVLATAPVENFVIEFLPDVARRIHIHAVLLQRIINQVAKTGGS